MDLANAIRLAVFLASGLALMIGLAVTMERLDERQRSTRKR
jgi:hypothetical protein